MARNVRVRHGSAAAGSCAESISAALPPAPRSVPTFHFPCRSESSPWGANAEGAPRSLSSADQVGASNGSFVSS